MTKHVKTLPPAPMRLAARFLPAFAAVLLLPFTARAEPSAGEILRSARVNQSSQHRTLEGQLRNGDTRVPFRLLLEGNVIRYQFSNPSQTLTLRLDANGSRLEGIPAEKLEAPVRNTDISYEDLTLRFLYWPGAKMLGEQKYLFTTCWKIEVTPGRGDDSQYGRVELLIDQRSGALMRASGYDPQGNYVRRFEVRSVQKIEGGWILKQMRVERMENGRTMDREPTYLEITGS